MLLRSIDSLKEPKVSCTETNIRLCLVFDTTANASVIIEDDVCSRVVDPAQLLPGTWAVMFRTKTDMTVNHKKFDHLTVTETPITLIARRLYDGRYFASHFSDVASALKHDGKRPVIELPFGRYNNNPEDDSNKYRVVHRGMRVISPMGDLMWPPSKPLGSYIPAFNYPA